MISIYDQAMGLIDNARSPGELNAKMTALLIKAIERINRGPTFFEMVREFHQKMRLSYDGLPRELPYALRLHKHRHLKEELQEYIDGMRHHNLEEQLDALVDIVYVTLGAAAMHGFDFNEAFRRVHEANMQKMRASDRSGKRGSEFDVIKPEGWTPPQLEDLV